MFPSFLDHPVYCWAYPFCRNTLRHGAGTKYTILKTLGQENADVACSPYTGCVEKMYPIFESEWLIMFSELRHGFGTIVKKRNVLDRKSCSFRMLRISIQWGHLNGQLKRAFTSLFPSESGGPRELVHVPSLSPNSPLCFLDLSIMFTPLWGKLNSTLNHRSCTFPMSLFSI